MRRIKRDESTEELVFALTNEGSQGEPKIFETIEALYVFAAALGYSKRLRKKLERASKNSIRFDVFKNTNIFDLLAIAEAKSTEMFSDTNEDEVACIFEEYAHGGLDYLKGRITKPGVEYSHVELVSCLITIVNQQFCASNDPELDLTIFK